LINSNEYSVAVQAFFSRGAPLSGGAGGGRVSPRCLAWALLYCALLDGGNAAR
jgi:hypothetical protein